MTKTGGSPRSVLVIKIVKSLNDAGHSSGPTTDKYIDMELRARHAASAKKKKVK